MEFKGMLQMDYDAHNLGALLPSYVGGEIGYYSDQNRDWSEEDYELWLEMLCADGAEKRDLQRQLHQHGILHQPEGPKDLPWNPIGAAGHCAAGASGVSTAIGVYQGVRKRRWLARSRRSRARLKIMWSQVERTRRRVAPVATT